MEPTFGNILIIFWTNCFSAAALLGAGLLLFDASFWYEKFKAGSLRSHDHWQTGIAIFFDITQTGLFIAGAVLSGTWSYPVNSRHEWLDLASLCTLQLLAGTNLARLIRTIWKFLWMTLVIYGVILALTGIEIAIYVLSDEFSRDYPRYLYGPVLIALAIVLVICSIVALTIYRPYRTSRRDLINLLNMFFSTNLLAAACKLGGGITLVVYSSKDQNEHEAHVRQVCIIACLFTEGVASLTFFSKAFRDRFYQKVRSSARKLSAQLGNDEDGSSRLFRTFTTRSGRPSTTRSRREHGSDTALDDIPKVPERVYTFSGYFRDDRDYETV